MPYKRKKKSKFQIVLRKIGVKVLKTAKLSYLRAITGFDSFLKFMKFLKARGVLYDILKIVGKGILGGLVPDAIVTAYDVILDADDLYNGFKNLRTVEEKFAYMKEATIKYGRDALPDIIQRILMVMEQLMEFKNEWPRMTISDRAVKLREITAKAGLSVIPNWVIEAVNIFVKSYETSKNEGRRKSPVGLKGKLAARAENKYEANPRSMPVYTRHGTNNLSNAALQARNF